MSARPTLAPSSARPAWVSEAHFVEETEAGLALYGVGSDLLEDAFSERCVDVQLALDRAANRGRAELARLIEGPTTVATSSVGADASKKVAIATIRGSEVVRGWFDGERTLYVLVRAMRPLDAAGDLPPGERELSPEGGGPARSALEAAMAKNRASLEANGACNDANRRSDLPCCGPLQTFCADPTRFDHRPTDDTCACGDGDPCLFDYRCEVRGGAPRCLCRGPNCPCEELTCRSGQTCEDARCY